MFKWIADIIKSIANSNMSSGAKAFVIIAFTGMLGLGYIYIDFRKTNKEEIELTKTNNSKLDYIIKEHKSKDQRDSVRFCRIENNLDKVNYKVDTMRDRQIIDGIIMKELINAQKKEVIEKIENTENIFQQLKRNNNSYYMIPKQTPVIIKEEQVYNIPLPEPEVKKNERRLQYGTN